MSDKRQLYAKYQSIWPWIRKKKECRICCCTSVIELVDPGDHNSKTVAPRPASIAECVSVIENAVDPAFGHLQNRPVCVWAYLLYVLAILWFTLAAHSPCIADCVGCFGHKFPVAALSVSAEQVFIENEGLHLRFEASTSAFMSIFACNEGSLKFAIYY